MERQNFIAERVYAFQRTHPEFSAWQSYRVFTAMCVKYFFFHEAGANFDAEEAAEYLTDGKGDGGIDAVFNDPGSEDNDMIIVQSKYYENSQLTGADAAGELYKILETIKSIDSHRVEGLSEKMVSAYRNAKSQMGDNGQIRIVFFSSYEPKNKRERNKIEKSNEEIFRSYDLEFYFRADIEAQVEIVDSGKLYADYGVLRLDRRDNYLEYEDSAIVNISAQSLQELQNLKRNGLLGMNLRFYVRQKAVDDGIDNTIRKEPENFWYKNNGIIIICEDYEIDGTVLRLRNFSIINGGQTTNRIGRMDIERDFLLQCKVVKIKGGTADEKDRFTHNIAGASNAQKAVKKADLKSNTPEQLRLRERLSEKGVYYITKKGDKIPKKYSEPYQYATLEQVGKWSLAAVLQMPGSARSNLQRMYQDEYYYPIFAQNAKAGVIADLLKISWYYDQFVKDNLKDRGYDERTTLPMMKNGKTFQLACVAFLCKISYGVFSYDTVASLIGNADELKSVLRQMGQMERLISCKTAEEQDLFFTIFDAVGNEALGYCFENALERAEQEQRTLAPSDYLKSDANYYKDVVKRLWNRYRSNEELRKAVKRLCGQSD